MANEVLNFPEGGLDLLAAHAYRSYQMIGRCCVVLERKAGILKPDLTIGAFNVNSQEFIELESAGLEISGGTLREMTERYDPETEMVLVGIGIGLSHEAKLVRREPPYFSPPEAYARFGDCLGSADPPARIYKFPGPKQED